MRAEANLVAIFQEARRGDALAVDKRAIAAAQIFNDQPLFPLAQAGVRAGDALIVEEQVGRGNPANDRRQPGEVKFLPRRRPLFNR